MACSWNFLVQYFPMTDVSTDSQYECILHRGLLYRTNWCAFDKCCSHVKEVSEKLLCAIRKFVVLTAASERTRLQYHMRHS